MTQTISTTPEQSRRLIACGVDPKTADMNRRYGSYPVPILQFDLNGNLIAEYGGIREAERKTKLSHGCIVKCCKEKTPKVANYIFIYKDRADTISDRISQIPDISYVNFTDEEWREVKGFEGMYEVSNYGRVKTLSREIVFGHGRKIASERLLTAREIKVRNRKARAYVYLTKNGKSKNHLVHRLVAMAFLPNPDNLPQINHKDEDPLNNHVDNLEWCTAAYNLSYNDLHKRNAIKRINSGRYAVVQLDDNNNFIAEFPSAIEAARQMGCALGSVSRCINGVRKHAAGYKWMLKSEWLTKEGYKLNTIE